MRILVMILGFEDMFIPNTLNHLSVLFMPIGGMCDGKFENVHVGREWIALTHSTINVTNMRDITNFVYRSIGTE